MTHTADKLDLKECLAYAKPLFTYGLSFMRKWLLKDSMTLDFLFLPVL